jgi:hypothetical protein
MRGQRVVSDNEVFEWNALRLIISKCTPRKQKVGLIFRELRGPLVGKAPKDLNFGNDGSGPGEGSLAGEIWEAGRGSGEEGLRRTQRHFASVHLLLPHAAGYGGGS